MFLKSCVIYFSETLAIEHSDYYQYKKNLLKQRTVKCIMHLREPAGRIIIVVYNALSLVF